VVAPHRVRLERHRAELTARVRSLQHSFDEMVAASRDSNADDEHDPEGATIAFERAQLVAVLKQATADLDELDAAVRRLDDGTYGVCERCGLPIAPARLEARPAARRCIGCAALGLNPAGSGDHEAGAELGRVAVEERVVAFGPST